MDTSPGGPFGNLGLRQQKIFVDKDQVEISVAGLNPLVVGHIHLVEVDDTDGLGCQMHNARCGRIQLHHGIFGVTLKFQFLIWNIPVPYFVSVRLARICGRKDVRHLVRELFELGIQLRDHLLCPALVLDLVPIPSVPFAILHERFSCDSDRRYSNID